MSNESVHIRLNFNNMIMSVCEEESLCHKEAIFWMRPSKLDDVDMFCMIHGIELIQTKEHFGLLVGSSIVKVKN